MERICDVTDESLKALVEESKNAGPDTGVCPVEASLKIATEALKNSCGKGVMCRDGLRQVYLILADIVNGRGKADDYELLDEILGVIVECADCDLSYTAAFTIQNLMHENQSDFEEHIKRKSCKNLICVGCHTVHINAALCKGSGECIKACPAGAIKGGEDLFSVIDQAKCTKCNICIDKCPNGAIKGAGFIKPQGPTEPGPVGSFGAAAGGRRRRRGG